MRHSTRRVRCIEYLKILNKDDKAINKKTTARPVVSQFICPFDSTLVPTHFTFFLLVAPLFYLFVWNQKNKKRRNKNGRFCWRHRKWKRGGGGGWSLRVNKPFSDNLASVHTHRQTHWAKKESERAKPSSAPPSLSLSHFLAQVFRLPPPPPRACDCLPQYTTRPHDGR